MRSKQDVDARSELDQADTLAALKAVSNFRVEHDAARQQAGDLFEDDFLAVAFNGDDVLLILSAETVFMAFRNWPR